MAKEEMKIEPCTKADLDTVDEMISEGTVLNHHTGLRLRATIQELQAENGRLKKLYGILKTPKVGEEYIKVLTLMGRGKHKGAKLDELGCTMDIFHHLTACGYIKNIRTTGVLQVDWIVTEEGLNVVTEALKEKAE